VTALILIAAASACSDEADARSDMDGASEDPRAAASAAPAERSEPSSSSGEARSDELLCDVIEDDEALMPPGGQTIDVPGVGTANSERRCIFALGVDTPIEEARGFYRSRLADLGYQIDRFDEGDGIARGNLSRTSIRAMKPGLQVSLQLDEFDPSQTPIADYRVQGRVQIDAMRQ
jgi:hypothetical protein